MDMTAIADGVSTVVAWAADNWTPLLLTGEVIGAVVAIKMGRYSKGLLWLAAALLTIWVGWL